MRMLKALIQLLLLSFPIASAALEPVAPQWKLQGYGAPLPKEPLFAAQKSSEDFKFLHTVEEHLAKIGDKELRKVSNTKRLVALGLVSLFLAAILLSRVQKKPGPTPPINPEEDPTQNPQVPKQGTSQQSRNSRRDVVSATLGQNTLSSTSAVLAAIQSMRVMIGTGNSALSLKFETSQNDISADTPTGMLARQLTSRRKVDSLPKLATAANSAILAQRLMQDAALQQEAKQAIPTGNFSKLNARIASIYSGGTEAWEEVISLIYQHLQSNSIGSDAYAFTIVGTLHEWASNQAARQAVLNAGAGNLGNFNFRRTLEDLRDALRYDVKGLSHSRLRKGRSLWSTLLLTSLSRELSPLGIRWDTDPGVEFYVPPDRDPVVESIHDIAFLGTALPGVIHFGSSDPKLQRVLPKNMWKFNTKTIASTHSGDVRNGDIPDDWHLSDKISEAFKTVSSDPTKLIRTVFSGYLAKAMGKLHQDGKLPAPSIEKLLELSESLTEEPGPKHAFKDSKISLRKDGELSLLGLLRHSVRVSFEKLLQKNSSRQVQIKLNDKDLEIVLLALATYTNNPPTSSWAKGTLLVFSPSSSSSLLKSYLSQSHTGRTGQLDAKEALLLAFNSMYSTNFTDLEDFILQKM